MRRPWEWARGLGHWFRYRAEWLRRRSRQIGRFSLFVLVASVFWYLTKLNHEYVVEVAHGVLLERHPPGRLLVGPRERTVWIRLRGRGYALLRYGDQPGRSVLRIDLRDEAHSLILRGDSLGVIPPKALAKVLAPHLPGSVRLESVLSDTLRCPFSPLATRKVRVAPQLRYRPAAQCYQPSEMVLLPDSVWVTGPALEIDTLSQAPTVPLDLGELYGTYQDWVDIAPGAGDIDYEPTRVRVNIPITEYTQIELRIPITLKGLPDSLEAHLLPDYVTLQCNVPLAQCQEIGPEDFHVVAIYSPFSPNDNGKLPVRILTTPPGVRHIEFTPQFVTRLVHSRR